jgi:RNA 2',3'-cyclic 3'-phosphodiesterase
MSVIRAFIAISLSPEITQQLEMVLSGLKNKLPGGSIRWVPAKNIHLTLKFLGEVSISSQEMLTKLLQAESNRHASFEISVGELGVFPSLHRPRVVWIGVEAPPELAALQHGLEAEMARLGYAPEERPFSPHLTLGRVVRNANSEEIHRISELLGKTKVGFLGAFRVQSVHLFRSDLQPGGSIYTRLFTANLATGG